MNEDTNMGDEQNWGEARVRTRQRRRWRRVAVVIAVCAGALVGVPFVMGLSDGLSGAPNTGPPHAAALLSAVTFVASLLFAGYSGWRDTDEVQRRIAANTWAVVGIVGFVGHPIVEMANRLLHAAIVPEQLWWATLAAGIVAYVWQRVRR